MHHAERHRTVDHRCSCCIVHDSFCRVIGKICACIHLRIQEQSQGAAPLKGLAHCLEAQHDGCRANTSAEEGDNASSSAKTTPGGVTPVIKAVVKRLSGEPSPLTAIGSSLKVHAVTFNMNTHLPTLMQTAALLGLEARSGHAYFHPSCDVYAVGTQESGGLKPWRKLISRCLGGHYVRLASESLMAISLLLYVRRSLANECSEVSTSTIATGVNHMVIAWLALHCLTSVPC